MMGKWIIYLGIALVVIGAMFHYAPWTIGWFGKLPGDIRIETGRTRVFIPLTSMIVVSVVLTIVVHLLRR